MVVDGVGEANGATSVREPGPRQPRAPDLAPARSAGRRITPPAARWGRRRDRGGKVAVWPAIADGQPARDIRPDGVRLDAQHRRSLPGRDRGGRRLTPRRGVAEDGDHEARSARGVPVLGVLLAGERERERGDIAGTERLPALDEDRQAVRTRVAQGCELRAALWQRLGIPAVGMMPHRGRHLVVISGSPVTPRIGIPSIISIIDLGPVGQRRPYKALTPPE